MRTEQQRYDAAQAQIKKHLDDVSNDQDLATMLLRGQLVAELVRRNEQTHDRYRSLVSALIAVLQSRIDKLQWRAWMNAPWEWDKDESADAR
jgi:hypothetical protein